MRDLDLEYTYRLEESFWWFRGMRAVARPWLEPLGPRHVLDAGCGTGYHLRWLRGLWPQASVSGMDLSQTALQFARRRGGVSLVRASVARLPFVSDRFDLVTSFDVISQVPEGATGGVLAEFCRVLSPGGYLFVRVPAMPWLHSSHDKALQTFRRFTLASLSRAVEAAGFRVSRASYVNCLLFPLAAARRLLKKIGLFGGSDVRPLPGALGFVEPLLLAALRWEALRLARPGARLPFGLSLHLLARRP